MYNKTVCKQPKAGEGFMQKIKDFCKRHRLLWLTLLVALAAAAVAAWAGFDLGQRVDNQPVYEIVNDDYTRTVVIPATTDAATQDDGTTGLYLPVPLKSGQRIYGVRLDLTTHNWAFRHGTLYAALLDADGNAVANGELDCITIKDNTFAAITFDAPYTAPGTADAEADYDLANPNMTLRLWYTPGDDWDVYHLLGLWTDADTSQQMTRRNANGTTDSIVGHPALQYVVNDSGSWSHVISRLLGVLTFAAVVAGFILLTHRAKLWQVVLVCGAVLGVAFAFLTPPLVGPDEYTHLAKCYRQSSTLLGQPVADDDDMLLVRSCDAPYFKNHTGDIGIYAYKEMLEHLGDAGCSGETTVSSDTYVTADPINNTLYLGQIAGITLARMMGLGFHGMLLLGRLCNLALYLALATAAVNIAPQRLRGIFAGVALLAQPLQLAGSLSADAAVLGYLFCFTALCLTLRTRPARWPETVAAVVLAALIGPAKAIYLPAVLLIFMIPDANLALPGKRWPVGPIAKVLALVLAAIGWVQVNMGAALYAARDVDTVGILRAGGAAAAGAALLALLYWKIRRDPKKKKIFLGAIAAVVVLAIPVGLYKLTHMWGGLTPEQLVGSIQENGDSIYTYSAGYICRNLPNTAKLLLRSFSAQGAQWVQGVLGTALGEPIVYTVDASWVLGVGFILALLAAALPQAGETVPLGRRTKAGVWGIVLCVIALSFVTALNWTPINYTTIFGLQGRYWLPVLPLVLALVHHNRTFAVQKPAERKAVFAMLCLTSFVILQGAGLYATFQMPS